MPYIYTNKNTGQEVLSEERRLDLVGWSRWSELEVDDEQVDETLSFDSLTVAQLDAYAAEHGIEFPEGALKADKVAILAGE
jgi:hypothetical protein